MNTGFRFQCNPEYRILDEDQIKAIHRATLQLLESTGVSVKHPEAVELLTSAGCPVKTGDIVRIPGALVEECIESAPSGIIIYDRNGCEAMHLEGSNVHFGLGTDLLHTYDPESGELRPSRLQDVANAAKIADHFEDIDFVASFAHPHEVPVNLSYIESFKAQIENTIKPIFFTAAGPEDMAIMIDMAAVVAGNRDYLIEKPFLIHYSEPTSPLTHSPGAIQKLFYCADNRIPVNYTPGMLSGASGPVTQAGAITVANAEALSGIVLHQLKSRGAPIISGFGISTMDMAMGTPIYGCPEYRLALSACADLYHYYGIPMWGTAGVSDAHCLDQQAAMEMAISLLMAGLDGANLVHDVGYLGQGLIGSGAAIVMNAEIISYVKRILRGFDIDPDRIGLEVIEQVGPGGNFLTTEQTMELHRHEHWRPMFANRANLEQWQADGKKTYAEIAARKALDILKTHQCEALPHQIQKDLDAIVEDAEAALAGRHFNA
ncbi:MAG: trimethylamine methyltransferase family protein [Deltaproteobacteria bacterium]|jgi:trimethylamine--corrinoid protein Co-methyltransferase|nr:trimethylamine methyltransferase family protein [Deltaproteobacteria bacterium]